METEETSHQYPEIEGGTISRTLLMTLRAQWPVSYLCFCPGCAVCSHKASWAVGRPVQSQDELIQDVLQVPVNWRRSLPQLGVISLKSCRRFVTDDDDKTMSPGLLPPKQKPLSRNPWMKAHSPMLSYPGQGGWDRWLLLAWSKPVYQWYGHWSQPENWRRPTRNTQQTQADL